MWCVFPLAYTVCVACVLLCNVYMLYVISVYLYVCLICVCVVHVMWVVCRVYVSVWGWICMCLMCMLVHCVRYVCLLCVFEWVGWSVWHE